MKSKVALFVATWFYSGLIPPIILGGMAGTYGSFFSLPLCYAALQLARVGTGFSYWAIMLLVLLLGLWSVPKAEVKLVKGSTGRQKKKARPKPNRH